MNIQLRHHLAIRNALLTVALFVALCVLSGCKGMPSQADWSTTVQNCWSCTLYKALFDAINNLVTKLYITLASKALMLMGVGLLFWLAFRTVKMVTSLHEPNLQEYVMSVITTLFKALIVTGILLSGDGYLCVLDIIVTPVLTGFAELSWIVFTANKNINKGFVWPDELGGMTLEQCNLFSGHLAYQFQDLVFRVYVALNSGISLGYYMMVEKSFLNWVIGPFIMWMFFIMSLIFPMMFIDSFVRLGAVIVLSPFFFVAWVFPSTKQAIRQAWNVVFGATMQILIACIYIGLIIGVIELFATDKWPGMLGESRQTSDPSMMTNFKRLSTEAISFFALILILSRMQRNIPHISGYLGGDSSTSSMIGFADGIKQLAISATQIAVGAALSAFGIPGGAALMKAGAQRIAEQAKDAAQSAVAETMDTGSGAGGGGDSTMGQRAKETASFAKQGGQAASNTAKGAADGAKKGAEAGKAAGPKGAAAGAIIGGVAGGASSGMQETAKMAGNAANSAQSDQVQSGQGQSKQGKGKSSSSNAEKSKGSSKGSAKK